MFRIMNFRLSIVSIDRYAVAAIRLAVLVTIAVSIIDTMYSVITSIVEMVATMVIIIIKIRNAINTNKIMIDGNINISRNIVVMIIGNVRVNIERDIHSNSIVTLYVVINNTIMLIYIDKNDAATLMNSDVGTVKVKSAALNINEAGINASIHRIGPNGPASPSDNITAPAISNDPITIRVILSHFT